MPIYVTETKKVKKNSLWHWSEIAYMFADSRQELHDFAYRIGLHPYMFMNNPHFPYYPITASKRYKALDKGAHPMSKEQALQFSIQSTLCVEVQNGP